MKNLNPSNQKTFEALQSKANGKGRMPSVKRIASLFEELGIDFEMDNAFDIKQRFSESNNFATSKGKVVEGKRIKVKHPNPKRGMIVMDTTCTWFSKNTQSFADDFLWLIKLNEIDNK